MSARDYLKKNYKIYLTCFSVTVDERNTSYLSDLFISDRQNFLKTIISKQYATEVVLVQKCNSIEVYCLSKKGIDYKKIILVWKKFAKNFKETYVKHIQIFNDKQCVENLIKTMVGLRSVSVGDSQVLGQLRESISFSIENKYAGKLLSTLFSSSGNFALEVRKITGIGYGNTSVPRLVEEEFRRLQINKNKKILVVGCGKTGSLVCRLLSGDGYKNITGVNRTVAKAQELLSKKIIHQVLSFSDIHSKLKEFDVLLFAVSDFLPVIKEKHLNKSSIIFDVGNPRNLTFYPRNNLYIDIGYFSREGLKNKEKRLKNIDLAEKLILKKSEDILYQVYFQNQKNTITVNYHRDIKHYQNKKILKNIKLKSELLQVIRTWLSAHDFIEINTPCVVAVSTDPSRHNVNSELFSVKWYNKNLLLRQSNQLYKQMTVIAGLNKVFEWGPFWRAEINLTPRHLSEAWGLDVEMAGIEEIDQLLEVINNILIFSTESLYKKGFIKKSEVIKSNITKITYKEACELLDNNQISYKKDHDLGFEVERKLADIVKLKFNTDLFAVYNYPRSIKKFYTKSLNKNSSLTRTFDVFYKGWELSSGGVRETSRKELISSLIKMKLNPKKYDFYISNFTEHTKKHGGFCLGLDRFLARLINENNVASFVLYPRTPDSIIP